MAVGSLAPGMLLAAPTLVDTFFEQAVVLLLEANDDGAMGFMLNRTLGITLGELAGGMDFPVCEDYLDKQVFVGGPVTPERGWIFAKRNENTPEDLHIDHELGDGLMLLTEVEALRILLNTPNQTFRLMLGYSGWGETQLQDEMREGSWITHAMDADAVFSSEPDALWQTMLDAQGLGANMVWGRPIRDES